MPYMMFSVNLSRIAGAWPWVEWECWRLADFVWEFSQQFFQWPGMEVFIR